VRRGGAVGVVLLAVLLFFVGFGFAVVPPIVEQAQAFANELPRYVSQLQGNERILSFDERFGLLDRAETLVAITGLVPLIGATIGAIVVTTVAMFTSLQAGIICVVFYLVYQQVENYVLYPKIMQRSVNVSPAATVVAVLVGGSLLGALLAIPMAAGVQLVLDEVVAPRQDAA